MFSQRVERIFFRWTILDAFTEYHKHFLTDKLKPIAHCFRREFKGVFRRCVLNWINVKRVSYPRHFLTSHVKPWAHPVWYLDAAVWFHPKVRKADETEGLVPPFVSRLNPMPQVLSQISDPSLDSFMLLESRKMPAYFGDNFLMLETFRKY